MQFITATDQTPIQYLQNLRIERAKHLLESSKEPFERITLHVGYEDGNSFRRLFKEKVGLTPSAYRKKFETVGSDNLRTFATSAQCRQLLNTSTT